MTKKEKDIPLSPKHGLNPMVIQCFLCGGDAGLALLGKLKNDEKAPRLGVLPGHPPCQECQDLMEKGVLLIEVKDGSDRNDPYRTGRIHVIAREGASQIQPGLEKLAFAFIEESAARKIGLPDKGEIKNV